MKVITETKLFKCGLPPRITCDAIKEGLGAVLQKQQGVDWETTRYASRFSIEFEKKYFVNELDLLAVVWAMFCIRHRIRSDIGPQSLSHYS